VREYEFTFVVQPEISDEGVQAISQRFEGILSEHGSEKLFYEDWGRRRLAYEIRNFQKGHYQVLHFLSDGKVVPELERSARLDDSVLRFLTVLASHSVDDLDARRSEAVKFEEERVKRAAEKAEREAEEAARAAEEAAREDAPRDEDDRDDDDRDSDEDEE
jgi:small subunit ribosomal protein S6